MRETLDLSKGIKELSVTGAKKTTSIDNGTHT
jgi:hypothetical protein